VTRSKRGHETGGIPPGKDTTMAPQKKYTYRREDPNEQKRREREANRQANPRRPRTGVTIFKIAVGLSFFAISLAYIEDRDYGPMLFAWVLGGAFIAWGIAPYVEAHRIKKEEERARDERILNTPLEKFGDQDPFADQAEELAKHYEKKE
jgi:hypothetical protein